MLRNACTGLATQGTLCQLDTYVEIRIFFMIQRPSEGPINQRALIAYTQGHKSFASALKLAVKVFEKDKRQFTGVKYVSHAMTVASLLIEVKESEATLVVAALQDVLRKPAVTEEKLLVDFGSEVLALVKALQVGSSLSAYVVTLADADPVVHTVMAASLLDHICSIPRKSIKSAEAKEILVRADTLHTHLTKANPELLRRLTSVLRQSKINGLY